MNFKKEKFLTNLLLALSFVGYLDRELPWAVGYPRPWATLGRKLSWVETGPERASKDLKSRFEMATL